MNHKLIFFLVLGLCVPVGCQTRSSLSKGNESRKDPTVKPSAKSIVPVNAEARKEMLTRAVTWIGTDRQGRSLKEGPLQPKAHNRFSHNQDFRCKFLEPDPQDPPGGRTAKFFCVDEKDRDFKVKYQGKGVALQNGQPPPVEQIRREMMTSTENGRPGAPFELNSGVFGEVLATRFLWALGFPVDSVYPVRVTCDNCPPRPWRYLTDFFDRNDTSKPFKPGPRDSFVFLDSLIEVKLKMRKIEEFDAQGWSFNDDYPFVNEETKVQREALALLAAFIQHSDNKADNNRFVCLDDDDTIGKTTCDKPLLMLQDLGVTFGMGLGEPSRAARTANLEAFKKAPIWKDPNQCITQVFGIPSGVDVIKPVSEAARKFLVEKFDLVSDQDLRDMVEAANLENNFDRTTKLRVPTDTDDWVKTIKSRMDSLRAHKCPEKTP
jgi:hypothetical protein